MTAMPFLRWVVGAAMAVNMASAQAERMVTSGDFVIHFNAVSSLDIPPEVAVLRQITRSAQRAVVNIAVRQHRDSGDIAARARVEGIARNDVGQTQTIWFREVIEGDAIYYLADPRVELESPIAFEIDVQPEGSVRVTPLRFSQTFFAPR